nr:hypothetical protein [Tanacetum cinerariifolium]
DYDLTSSLRRGALQTLSFTKEDAERFLAMPIPPPSPLTILSSPLPQIPSPPLPASPPILPIPLHAASLPLQLLSSDRRADRPERLRSYNGEQRIWNGIRDTWIDPRYVAEEEALTTLEGVNTRVTELAVVQEQDTQDIYEVMEDTRGRQTEIFQRVEALVDDRQYHYETGRLVDQEARFSREAWAHSMGFGSAVHFELQGNMTHTWVQDQCIDVRDTLIATLTTQLSSLQGHLEMKMAPKKAAPNRTTRLNPGATPNTNSAPSTTTITVTNAQLQAMIDKGVNTALAARDANRTDDDSHTSGTGVRRTKRLTRECTYQDFMKCQPLYFKGTEGVVELTQWFERMEMVFRISNCLAENQIKFATCTLLAGALTWWNSHVKIVEESDRVERYIGGLPDTNHCPPTDRSDLTHEEFVDELAHIISPPEYDCFYFRNLPDLGELIFIFNSEIRENLSSTTCVNLPVEDDYSPLLAYVVWIFLAYLTYPVIPLYLHPFENEDTILDLGITINRDYSFKPGLSHRCGAFKKFNTHRSHLNEWPMIINGKNIPILDVLLFHFYPS